MPKSIPSRQQAAQIIRYVLVGGSAYVIEMATLWLLTHPFGLKPVAAVTVSFWVGFIVALVMQKIITFQNFDNGKRALGKQFIGYAALVAFNFAFTTLMVHLLQDHVPVAIIRTGVIALTTIWNFVAYKRLFAQ